MKSREIRQKFIEFFSHNGHTPLPSSPLIPANDPSLLFANAGMNQFKNIFLGRETRTYTRAVTVQKCMRAGGKHNDLENVGRTTRHLTFFEMLGNFSFADYFKNDAIAFAWQFLTKELKIEPEKLFVTVYEEDQEAYDIWHKEIGIPESRITRLGRKDNFWQMGDTGPCGPCSEIYVDKGITKKEEESCKPGDECERFMEIWNLVFMQYNRLEDGTEIPLEKTGVDTGMGLERVTAFIQGVESAFDSDIFQPILASIEKLSGLQYKTATTEKRIAFRVIADHIRSSCLVIADGGMPSNEGRGYVIRKIIRRAALFAQKLGSSKIFAQLAPSFIDLFSELYPELLKNKKLIVEIISNEVEKFETNLTQGLTIFKEYQKTADASGQISGELAFKLYDTYGFPLELTTVLAEDAGLSVDVIGFENAMEAQRKQSGKKKKNDKNLLLPETIPSTLFTGYKETTTKTTITNIFVNNEPKDQLAAGETGQIITQASPFYIEGGGQVSDTGWIVINQEEKSPVTCVEKSITDVIVHTVTAQSLLTVGKTVTLELDKERRAAIQKNHSATHLLQSALIKTLGGHVKQAGSLVTQELLRFDFTHHHAPTKDELAQIEHLVNSAIMKTIPIECSTTNYKDAVSKGVIAFFGEKYNPEAVRVVNVPGFSAELCGGTHVRNTGEIGCFKILECSALSSGVKRIIAVTGFNALKYFNESYATVTAAAQLFKTKPLKVWSTIQEKQERLVTIEKELQKKEKELLIAQLLSSPNIATGNNALRMVWVENGNPKDFRDILQHAAKQAPGILVLISTTDKGTAFALYADTKAQEPLPIQALAEQLKEKFGLRGKVQGNFIQGGGNTVNIKELEKSIINWFSK